MSQSEVDVPSLIMVLCFTANMIVGIYDPLQIPIPKEIGLAVAALGFLLCAYVAFYLRRGFFGQTEPNLDYMITRGPYRFCRHPLYLSFIVIVLGFDLMSRSVMGLAFTFALSVPSVVYRARMEEKFLRARFGEEWESYANDVGFMFPRLGRRRLLSRDAVKIVPLVVLIASSLLAMTLTAERVPDEFESFCNFDEEENLIHIFSEEIFGLVSEHEAEVQEGEAITWGWEWFDSKKERVEDILEGSTTSLEVDGVEVLLGDWREYWSDIFFFPNGFDHDGDGIGDTDHDGIEDTPPGYAAAFRYTSVLAPGKHCWSFSFTDRTGLVTLSDSGTVTVQRKH